MLLEDYERISTDLLTAAHDIETSKRPGYTGDGADVLVNFKRIGERTGLTPMQVWAVYFLKHVDAITTAATNPKAPVSEALEGRFCDAINYLKLGWGLLQEGSRLEGQYSVDTLAVERQRAEPNPTMMPQAEWAKWRTERQADQQARAELRAQYEATRNQPPWERPS